MRAAPFEVRWRRYIQALRAECPTAMGLPVTVRTVDRPGPRGETLSAWATERRDGQGFRIVVRRRYRGLDGRVRRSSPDLMLADLIHEWAHVMAWTPTHASLTDHDASWGVAYSRAYGAVVED